MSQRPAADGEARFLPSRDLPSLQGRTATLGLRDATRALRRLRRGYGLPELTGSAAARARLSEEDDGSQQLHFDCEKQVRSSPWTFNALCPEDARLTKEADRAAAAPCGADRAAEVAEDSQLDAADEFEDRVARAWLQRLISGRVTLLEDDDTPADQARGDEPSAEAWSEEEILEGAAGLLAVMSGQAASGPSTVTYVFHRSGASSSGGQALGALEGDTTAAIREPLRIPICNGSLVDDALGARTWGAAPLLVVELLNALDSQPGPLRPPSAARRSRILELGAGTGLAGIALAAALDQSEELQELVLTDHHPTVLANLRGIVQAQPWLHQSRQATDGRRAVEQASLVRCAKLDWYQVYREARVSQGDAAEEYTSYHTTAQTLPAAKPDLPESQKPAKQDGAEVDGTFDTLIAADCIYDPVHPSWIKSVAERHLSKPSFCSSLSIGGAMTEAEIHALPKLHILSPMRSTHTKEIEALRLAFPRAERHSAGMSDGDGDWQLRTVREKVLVGYDNFSGARWRASAGEAEDGGYQGERYEYLYLQISWAKQCA